MQRIADWRRERRIRRLCEVCKAHMAAGRSDEGRLAWALVVHEIKNRSPQQIARMERAARDRLDPHSREIFDRHAQ